MNNLIFRLMMATTCLGMVASDATAQERGGREGDDRGRPPQFGGQAGRGGFMRVLPIMTALDADGNGEISDAEIKDAVAALRKLDKNKDDKLTAEELRPNFGGNRSGRGGSGIPDRSRVSVTQPLKTLPPVAKQIGGVSTREILQLFSAKGRHGGTERELANYRRVFGFTDADRDGRHSKKEYFENGAYLTPQSRQGIFQASDSNNDGFVSEAEYVENRLITDEAKLIFSDMDANGNNRLTAKELLASGKLKDEKLAKGVFKALDTNEDGELIIPEYLRVWGRWARH
jgi:Ca2+-binding EF-hand superfamily protein